VVARLIEALRYKPASRGFDSRWCQWIFSLAYDPGVDSASNRNEYQEYCLGGKCCRCVWLTTFMCRLSRNLGASTSWNPVGLSRPVTGLLYLYLYLLVAEGFHLFLWLFFGRLSNLTDGWTETKLLLLDSMVQWLDEVTSRDLMTESWLFGWLT
jgi:hypothetical protein